MRRARFLAGTVIAAAVSLCGFGIPSAGASEHLATTFSVPDTVCGFAGISQWTVVDNFGSLANGGSYDDGRMVQIFTADNGRGVEIDYGAGHSVFSPLTPNGDGTFTQVLTASGLDVLTKAINGPVLEHGAGRGQVTFVQDAQGNPISVTPVVLSGHQPNTTGAPDCSVIGPYLAGA